MMAMMIMIMVIMAIMTMIMSMMAMMIMIMLMVRFCESGDGFQWTVATQVPSVLLFHPSLLII